MKIAVWNIERLKHKKFLDEITSICNELRADILVLTETDERVKPDYKHCFFTPTPADIVLPYFNKPLHYAEAEHRVAIYTDYNPIRLYPTFDKETALCIELETDYGNLLVYGTIIGTLGNRTKSYEQDIIRQTEDFAALSSTHNICICGDFNCSFADNYYYTKNGRQIMLQSFSENNIRLLTGKTAACIDHIAVSEQFVGNRMVHIEEWNIQKNLSDHKGISVQFNC